MEDEPGLERNLLLLVKNEGGHLVDEVISLGLGRREPEFHVYFLVLLAGLREVSLHCEGLSGIIVEVSNDCFVVSGLNLQYWDMH